MAALISILKSINQTANRHAGKVMLLGLSGVALYNWRTWQKDKPTLASLQEPTALPALESWPRLPKVSVLVAAWNESAHIERHIESFQALRYPHKELVLCAGGTDGTYDMAKKYASEVVKVLEQHPGEGKQRALRKAFPQTDGG